MTPRGHEYQTHSCRISYGPRQSDTQAVYHVTTLTNAHAVTLGMGRPNYIIADAYLDARSVGSHQGAPQHRLPGH